MKKLFLSVLIFVVTLSSVSFANCIGDISQVGNVKCVTEYDDDTYVEDMDTVIFGSYPQSDASGNTKEPIEWIVLEKQGDKALLMSKYILDSIDNFKGDIWERSIIRKFSNEKFFNNAFSEYEKKRIFEVENLNNENPAYQTSSLNTTKDKIFLLSIEEVKKYFGINEFKEIVKIPKRQAYIYTMFKNIKTSRTKYFINKKTSQEIEIYKAKGIEFGKDKVEEMEKGWEFSLRTNGKHDREFTYCGELEGNIIIDLEGDYGYMSMRPAIWVSLK